MSPMQTLSLLLALTIDLNIAITAGILTDPRLWRRRSAGDPHRRGRRSYRPGYLLRRRRRLQVTVTTADVGRW
ncbi:hypothetical protein ACWGLP_18870 [Streptomyces lydicus]